MHKDRIIPISNQIDIHAARMYTREAARLIGLELVEQARVSLATSTLAECLKTRASGSGQVCSQVSIHFLNNGTLQGLQVNFETNAGEGSDAESKQVSACIQSQLHKIQTLVDEVTIETGPDGNLRVQMIKWQPQTSITSAESNHQSKITGETIINPDSQEI